MEIRIKYQISTMVILFLAVMQMLTAAENNQPKIMLGVFGDYNLNQHVVDFDRLPGVPSCCPRYKTGSGNGYSFGALFERRIVKNLNFQLRLGYSDLNAVLKANEEISNVFFIENGTNQEIIKPLTLEHTLDAKLQGLVIEPLFNFMFFRGLTANLGCNFTWFFTQKIDQMEKIVSPSNVRFLDGNVVRNAKTGLDIPNNNPIQFFGVLGLSYELPISRKIFVTPEIRYSIPFMNISKDVSWKVYVLQIGTSLKIVFY